MQNTNEIIMDFNSNLKFTEFSVMVLNFLKNILNMTENDSFETEISLREAINNAIIHGNKSQRNKRVYLNFSWGKNSIKIKVTDENRDPVDIQSLSKQPKEPDILAFSGRGILLMKNYMDNVKFEKSSSGTSVILEKFF